MTITSLRSCRRGAASMIFAIAVIPILGFCGLAIDYGIWSRIEGQMQSAANTAALNAVKIAATAEINKDENAAAEGNAAGAAWFAALAGKKQAYMAGTVTPVVKTTVGATVTANVSFTGAVNSIFGRLFFVSSYPLGGEVQASENIATFVNIEVAVDNSPSMGIGASDVTGSYPARYNQATNPYLPKFNPANFRNVGRNGSSDVNVLEQLSPCWPGNALYELALPSQNYPAGYWQANDGEVYENYQYQYGGLTYSGNAPSPVQRTITPLLQQLPNGTFTEVQYPQANPTAGVSSCYGAGTQLLYRPPGSTAFAYPLAGPPCAFACHSDGRGLPTSQGNDLYAMARQNNVTLRFDLVKAATNNVLKQMEAYNLANNNLKVGIFTFDQIAHQQYPVIANQVANAPNGFVPPCETNGLPLPLDPTSPEQRAREAGSNWNAAIAAVGDYNGVTDTGIQPVVALLGGANGGVKGSSGNDDTAIANSLKCMATNYLTASGTGKTAASPAKYLFLITDGYEDNGVTGRQPLNPAACDIFKNPPNPTDPSQTPGLGYTIFVIYTPYYQVKHQFFFANMYNQVVAPPGGQSPLETNLANCSSDPQNDYIEASNLPEMNAALSKFLRAALDKVARFNM